MKKEFDDSFNTKEDSANIRIEIEKFLVHWKWFVISIFICLSISILYIKSSVDVYENLGTLLIKNESSSSELQAFTDLSSFGIESTSNVVDEVEILKSRALTERVVKELELNCIVTQKRGLKEIELYDNRPFSISVLSDSLRFYELDTILDIHIIDNLNFEYQLEGTDTPVLEKFGEPIKIGDYKFVLNSNSHKSIDTEVVLEFKKLENVISKYNKQLIIETVVSDSNIIILKLEDPIKIKAKNIINALMSAYNSQSIEDKNLVGVKTDAFISNRLSVIKQELDEIDKLEENYKKNQKLTDIEIQSGLYVSGQTENEKAIFDNETELRLVEFMVQDIEEQGAEFELLPANINISSGTQLGVSIEQYNQTLFERNKLLSNSYNGNLQVQNYNKELSSLRKNIKEALLNTKSQLRISINSLREKEKELNQKILEIPTQVKHYTAILRKQKIIAELYSYLLQKKQENEISMAVMVPDAKVVDDAYSINKPVEPNKKIIALLGLVLGFAIPFSVIYLKDLLDTKFHTKSDLKGIVSVPLLGDIPFDDTEEKVVIRKGSRTSTAEAFRLLRTNLDFMLTPVGSKSKIVFVTSTISGEGKTFVSVNTAASLALTGKKVLLMGMDLRAPKITQYLDLPNRNGVTNYIIDQEANLAEMVTPLAGFENLDLLSSGVVPPNPAELLLSPKIGEMFAELRKMYDYIVVDTAPVNLVTDTLMLSQHADMFLYVSRANYLDKRMLEVPERLYREKRLPNMAILINGLDHSRGYGYGYGGYGYPAEESNKNFFQKIFKS